MTVKHEKRNDAGLYMQINTNTDIDSTANAEKKTKNTTEDKPKYANFYDLSPGDVINYSIPLDNSKNPTYAKNTMFITKMTMNVAHGYIISEDFPAICHIAKSDIHNSEFKKNLEWKVEKLEAIPSLEQYLTALQDINKKEDDKKYIRDSIIPIIEEYHPRATLPYTRA